MALLTPSHISNQNLTASIDHLKATQMVQSHLDPGLIVQGMKPLQGGAFHRVYRFQTNGEPRWVVAKLTDQPNHPALLREAACLRFCHKENALPVPKVWAVSGQSSFWEGSFLLMEYLSGTHWAAVEVSMEGRIFFQRQLAQALVRLHTHRRETYGPLGGTESFVTWLDRFGPIFQHHFELVREQLSSSSRFQIDKLLGKMDVWFSQSGPPTLIHGDLWASNILVNDAHPDRPQLLGFVDCEMEYADVEYELAYLRLFGTVGDSFFEYYQQHHTLRSGFQERCLLYWLNTMLQQIHLFGSKYVGACERMVARVKKIF